MQYRNKSRRIVRLSAISKQIASIALRLANSRGSGLLNGVCGRREKVLLPFAICIAMEHEVGRSLARNPAAGNRSLYRKRRAISRDRRTRWMKGMGCGLVEQKQWTSH
jgi:hypothetical protein